MPHATIVTFSSVRNVSSEIFRASRKIRPTIQGDAPQDGVAGRGGLLVDLLEHEVPVSALLGGDGIPCHSLGCLGHLAAAVVGERDTRPRDDRHLLVAEKHDVARVAENRGNIGSDEEFVVAEPDNDRRAVAHGHDLLRVLDRHEDQREHAAQERQGAADRVFQPVTLRLALDEMGDDFSVGFGLEVVALRLKLTFQLQVVLDNAVVHDDDAAGAIAMRMRVLFRRSPVRRPAGVTDAVQTVDRLRANRTFEVDQLARRSAK